MPESQAHSDKSDSRACLLHSHGCYEVKRPVKSTSHTLDIYAVIDDSMSAEIGKSDDRMAVENNDPSPSMFLVVT